MKADSLRTLPSSIVSTVATVGGMGHGARRPRGGEREENVPTRDDAPDAATLTPHRVTTLLLSTRTSFERTDARPRAI
jgi:hypothetical protein